LERFNDYFGGPVLNSTRLDSSVIDINDDVQFSEKVEGFTRQAAEEAMQKLRLELRRSKKSGNLLKTDWALLHMAMIMRGQHRHQTAIQLLEDIRSTFKVSGDQKGEGYVFLELSICHRELQRNALAIEYGHKALELFQALNQPSEVGWACNNMAMIHLNMFHRHESLVYAKKGRALFTQLGSKSGQAWNASILATLHYEMGFFKQAKAFSSEALRIFTQLKNKQGIGWSLLGLGVIYREQSRFEAAESFLQKAQALFESLKIKDRVGWCVINGAGIKRSQGKDQEALLLNRKGIQIFSPDQNRDGVAWSLFQMGQIYRDRGQLTKAWQVLKEALSLHSDIANRKGIGWVENELGGTYLEVGDPHRARESFIKSKVIADQLDEMPLNIKVSCNLARLSFEEGSFGKANDLLTRAAAACQKIGAKEPYAEILLEQTRIHFFRGDLVAARKNLVSVKTIIQSQGLHRLKSLSTLYIGELFLRDKNVEAALKVWKDTVEGSENQRHQKVLALMGILQIMAFHKNSSRLSHLISDIEKEIKNLGSRKTRAKYLVIKGLISARENGKFDFRNFSQAQSVLQEMGLPVIQVQMLKLLSKAYRQRHIPGQAEECDIKIDQIQKSSSPDVKSLAAKTDLFSPLPISLVL